MSEEDRQSLISFPTGSYDVNETTSNTFSREQSVHAQWDRGELANKSRKSCKSNDSGLSEQEMFFEGCHKVKDTLDEYMPYLVGLQKQLNDTEKLRESFKDAERENQRLQAEKVDMREKTEHLEEEKKRLEGGNKHLEEENKRLGEENDRLERENMFLEEENKRLVGEKTLLGEENKSLFVENKRLHGETKLQEENERLQDEMTGLRKENNRLLTDLESVMKSLVGVVKLQDSQHKTVKNETNAIVQYLIAQYGFTLQNGADKYPIACSDSDRKQEDTPTHNGNQQTLQETMATSIHPESKTKHQPQVPMKLDRATQSDLEVQSTHSNPKKCASEMVRQKLPAISQQNGSPKPPCSNDVFIPTSNESFPPLSSDNGIQLRAKGTKRGSREKTTTSTESYIRRLLSPVNNKSSGSK